MYALDFCYAFLFVATCQAWPERARVGHEAAVILRSDAVGPQLSKLSLSLMCLCYKFYRQLFSSDMPYYTDDNKFKIS